MVDLHADDIELVESRYDRWREAFRAERDRLRTAVERGDCADAVERIEHVGSTAVPELAAKDVVDIDVVVADGRVDETARCIAAELGGTRYENSDEWQPVARERAGQQFNDHVFAESADGWRVSVATRAVLRARPDLRDAYERRKRALAAEHDDIVAYSEGKDAIMDRILDAAADDGVDVPCSVPVDG